MASLITSLIVMLTLIFLTPIFTYLPQAAVGGVIVVAVLNLLDLKALPFLYKSKQWYDVAVLLGTVLVTVSLFD